MGWSDTSAYVLAPFGAAPRATQRLAGSGTTEANNTTALTPGAQATIVIGAVAVRVAFGAADVATATTDMILPAYGRFDWTVEVGSTTVSIEAADGTSAYEAWVWTSSPGM